MIDTKQCFEGTRMKQFLVPLMVEPSCNFLNRTLMMEPL